MSIIAVTGRTFFPLVSYEAHKQTSLCLVALCTRRNTAALVFESSLAGNSAAVYLETNGR